MTPPNGAYAITLVVGRDEQDVGDERRVPLIVVVALAEPGTPVVCC
jgi:hypothetical protein